mgnify:CR=1 FL=1
MLNRKPQLSAFAGRNLNILSFFEAERRRVWRECNRGRDWSDHEDLDKQKTLDILDKILSGETPKPGSYRGRVNNEPENNRKTLMDLKNA